MKSIRSPVMAWLVALLFFTLLSPAFAQQLPFPDEAVTDDAALSRTMPGLARNIMAVYRDADRDTYLGNLFRLQLVAREYPQARATIRTLRQLRKDQGVARTETLFVQYEVYAEAKARQDSGKRPFGDALEQAFAEVYGGLDDKTAQRALSSFRVDLPAMRADLRKALDAQKDRNAIALADALDLVRKYQVHEAYADLLPRIDALVSEDDAKRYVIDKSVLVRTADGAGIAAMLVRPRSSTATPLPALLGFTIYANDDWSYADAKKAAAYGYAGVVAYTRGKGRSPDAAVVPYEHDGDDARAVIEWISRQSWNDGRVGMYGGSYNGFSQWAAAKHPPAALKALMTSATLAPGIDVPMQGGIFVNFIYPWPFYTTGNKTLDDAVYNDPARWDALNRNWYRSGKAYRALDSVDGVANPLFRRWLQHPDYDGYWQGMIPYRQEFAAVDIPVLATTGYFDGAQIGALYYFAEHNRYNRHADHTLLVGPYEHFTMQTGVSRVVQGYAIDPVADIDLQELRFQWFDYVFKNAAKPALLQDKVNYQVMGGNVWKHAASLEAMANGSLRLYLDPAGEGQAHRLSVEPAAGNAFVGQRIDFSDRSDDQWTPAPLAVGKTLDTHNGSAFVSAPLERATEISGLLSGRLDFTANKRDLDFSVALYELSPGGDYFQLLSYMARASYVRDRSHRRLLTPGRRQQLEFRSESLTSREVPAGSRLVVVLGINKRPDLQINYGTGKDVSDETISDAGKPLQVRWHGSSYVDIPVWK